ncbi:transposase [Streptomyces collinus]|uniref:transposase n=1 Tax=Streptomyces collinus TaxID=42684 RepID=UPI003695B4BE
MKAPGPRPVPDRQCLQGILYVLHTGIGWEDLPQELGFRSGMTCWRRIKRWINAGVFDDLYRILLALRSVRPGNAGAKTAAVRAMVTSRSKRARVCGSAGSPSRRPVPRDRVGEVHLPPSRPRRAAARRGTGRYVPAETRRSPHTP